MAKLTLGLAKPTIARVLGKSTNSTEVVDYINEAQARLMVRGDWRGTVVRYRSCVNDAKLTWPRWVEAIRKINVCHTNAPMLNRWYEFVGQGPGTLHDEDDPGLVHVDMGEAPTFDDIGGVDRVLKVQSDETETDTLYLIAQGYDENNEWIKTTHDGAIVDGEYILISSTPHYSTKEFSNVSAVRITGTTVGNVLLSEYEPTTTVTKPLGIYEPGETTPSYRRSRIPGLEAYDNCGCESDPCETGYTNVMVLAKLRHIPVVNDADWLVIGNLPALKDMVMSIVKAEKNLPSEADYYEARAIRELDKELEDHHKGETGPNVDVPDTHIFGFGSIQGVI
jgi:hypothetical protein